MLPETATGIYIAYPRSEKFKVAHAGPDTLVNRRHTKVGFAAESFLASAKTYRRAFDNRMQFIPLVEVALRDIPAVEKNVMTLMERRFRRVGGSSHWFDTQDRQAIITMIYSLLCPAANDPGGADEEAVETPG